MLALLTTSTASGCTAVPYCEYYNCENLGGDSTFDATSSAGSSDGETTGDTIGEGSDSTGSDSTGADGPPEPTNLQLTLSQVKQFDFSWSVENGADHYGLYWSPDGEMANFAPVQLGITADSVSITVPLHLQPNSSYRLKSCNAIDECADSAPLPVMGSMIEAVGYFKASNTTAADRFGSSVALDEAGMTFVVGAPNEDGGANESGAVYVFKREGAIWTFRDRIKALDPQAGALFGTSVALSKDGTILAVGAMSDDDLAQDSGAVYVFVRLDDVWTQVTKIKANNAGTNDQFGRRIDMSTDGDTIVVSAWNEDSLFEGVFNGAGIASVDDSVQSAGAIYVFGRMGNTWPQTAYLKAPVSSQSEYLGTSVAISGNGAVIAAGAYGYGGNAGAIYTYVLTANQWGQGDMPTTLPAPNDFLGWSVALDDSGSMLAVGASGMNGIGAVHTFARVGPDWGEDVVVEAPNSDSGDQFGRSVALSGDGNLLAVGADAEDGSSAGINGELSLNDAMSAGAVYLFTRVGAAWSEPVYIKAPTSDAGDGFGAAVVLSDNGETLAVGAALEDSNATLMGGDQTNDGASNAGASYLY